MSQPEKIPSKRSIQDVAIGTPVAQRHRAASRHSSTNVSPPCPATPVASSTRTSLRRSRKHGDGKPRRRRRSDVSTPAAAEHRPSSKKSAASAKERSLENKPANSQPPSLLYPRLVDSTSQQPAEAKSQLGQLELTHDFPATVSPEPASASPGAATVTGKPKMATKTGFLSSNMQLPSRKTGGTTTQMTQQESLKALNTILEDRMTLGSCRDATAGTRGDVAPAVDQRVRIVVLLAVGLCVVLVVIITYLRPRKLQDVKGLCRTHSCYAYWDRLRNQLDESIDPCDNFAAYVCGNWKPERRFGGLSESSFSEMVMWWRTNFQDIVRKASIELPVGRKVAAMFESCMTQMRSDVPTFLLFMRAHGLVFPGKAKARPPLEVLFDLAFNWNINLWFKVQLFPGTIDDPRRRILITTNQFLTYWYAMLGQVPANKFVAIYNALVRIFGGDEANLVTEEEIMEVYEIMHSIVEKFVRAGTHMTRFPAVFALRDVANYTELVTAEHVHDVIKKTLRINPAFSIDELLLLNDIAKLHAMLSIISTYDDTTLLRHLSWLFVYAYGQVAHPAAVLKTLFGSAELARAVQPRYCAVQVEASYKLLVAALASVAVFSPEERRTIDAHLEAIKQVTFNKASAMVWLDEKTKHVAKQKLLRVRTALWPPAELLTDNVLEDIYGKFPEKNDTTFMNIWIATRRNERNLTGTAAGVLAHSLIESTVLPYAQYEHLLNEVRLAVGALAPPLYYREGTKAMLYGGLMFFYAKSLISMFDSAGTKVDDQGRIVSSWLSEQSQQEFDRRVHDCLEKNTTVFPEVPAMEVAHAAFLRDSRSRPTRLSPNLTEHQVFFVTTCAASCAVSASDNLYGGDCNKAVMNFAPFAEAFNCPVGSKMNPVSKCTFFD
ncbi:membrane metallo-endopeptidase-like 1 [Dermacentor andersoni]|uniref:membrane metallo-endopeptidase-like 1 n=1 Tax=Dermacentor andersoni TaxID=34620 RepID=UPI002416F321|nr:endothelin-converting enzyme-like 1 [Dermacentor andersoni]